MRCCQNHPVPLNVNIETVWSCYRNYSVTTGGVLYLQMVMRVRVGRRAGRRGRGRRVVAVGGVRGGRGVGTGRRGGEGGAGRGRRRARVGPRHVLRIELSL